MSDGDDKKLRRLPAIKFTVTLPKAPERISLEDARWPEDPPEPTSDQCTAREAFEFRGRPSFAAWYPQMGGYGSHCIVVPCNNANPDDKPGDGCFDVYVWHDGEFPFSRANDLARGDLPRSPAHLHHCSAEQFVRFGTEVAARIAEIAPEEDNSEPARVARCYSCRDTGTTCRQPTRCGGRRW